MTIDDSGCEDTEPFAVRSEDEDNEDGDGHDNGMSVMGSNDTREGCVPRAATNSGQAAGMASVNARKATGLQTGHKQPSNRIGKINLSMTSVRLHVPALGIITCSDPLVCKVLNVRRSPEIFLKFSTRRAEWKVRMSLIYLRDIRSKVQRY